MTVDLLFKLKHNQQYRLSSGPLHFHHLDILLNQTQKPKTCLTRGSEEKKILINLLLHGVEPA
jgi:hypothetical protein